MRRLIINGDDFGLSPGVNRGILDAFREGILTSTTVLVNLPEFESAVAALQANGPPAGVHLNLSLGKPIAPPEMVPSLLDSTGTFPRSPSVLARRHFLGRLDSDHVAVEFRHQIQRFISTGLAPTHLDTHKHVHCLRPILSAMIKVAEEFQIKTIRWPVERSLIIDDANFQSFLRGTPWRNRLKRFIVNGLCAKSRSLINRADIAAPDYFIGLGVSGRFDIDAMTALFKHLPEGTTELMCHPGHADETTNDLTREPIDREGELAVLLRPEMKDALRKNDIELIGFDGLRKES